MLSSHSHFPSFWQVILTVHPPLPLVAAAAAAAAAAGCTCAGNGTSQATWNV